MLRLALSLDRLHVGGFEITREYFEWQWYWILVTCAVLSVATYAHAQNVFRVTTIPEEAATEQVRKFTPIASYLEKNFPVEGALRRQTMQNITRLKEIYWREEGGSPNGGVSGRL